jgi:5-methylcytosine-specific restriction endonuclease McrA
LSNVKPGWMRPLPKEDRGKGFLPVKTRGPLIETDAERELDFDALQREPFVDQLADASVAGGESLHQMRERLEQAGFHPDHVVDLLKAGTEIATQRLERQHALAAWSGHPETVEGRIAVHNARGARQGTLTTSQWRALLVAWGERCAYCGEAPATPTIEHVVPICRGGRTELGNVAPSCGPCNRLKRTKTAEEWLLDGYPAWKARFDAANEKARAAVEVKS